MSYSIYYDRAFIRVGDEFVPLVNSGSNNCFEFVGDRQVSEKGWGVLNWKHRGQLLFSTDEVRELAREYDEYNRESGVIYKSRHQQFGPGEFERWVINGMNRAYTVEEYHSFGNQLFVLDYSSREPNDWRTRPFTTAQELLDILGKLGPVRELNIKMDNNRNVCRPITHRPRGKGLRSCDLSECYVLSGKGTAQEINGQTVYFVKMTRHGFRYLRQKNATALKYIDKYEGRLNPFAAFTPELVTKASTTSDKSAGLN